LAQFRSQFVPLKVITKGEQWAKWATRYRADGNSIPFIYVVRADGEMLYGKSGSLSGPQLPQMMLTALGNSGRSFNDVQFAALVSAVEKAEQALKTEDKAAAVKALAGLKKLGALGQIGKDSHSTVAKRADEIVREIVASAQTEIDEAKAKLDDAQTSFDGVLALVEAERIYADLPDLNSSLRETLDEAKKNAELERLVTAAESLARARHYANLKLRGSEKRAITAYEQVITRYPGSAADKVARAELAEIDPHSEVLAAESRAAPPPASVEFRVWTDSSGQHKTDARLVAVKQGWVQLEKRDGQTISLPIQRLSAADQRYLRNQRAP
jgi:hypothetical protein